MGQGTATLTCFYPRPESEKAEVLNKRLVKGRNFPYKISKPVGG
jgi:hypothetical protein